MENLKNAVKNTNPVHEMENWNQRVRQEESQAKMWKTNWGFLESDAAKSGKTRVTEERTRGELDNILSINSPCYEYLERRKNQRAGIPDQPKEGAEQAKDSLYLDAAEATILQPRSLHAIGSSINTTGVDPVVKYSFPQTQSQVVGWRADSNLEFFGVAHHGRKRMNLKPSI